MWDSLRAADDLYQASCALCICIWDSLRAALCMSMICTRPVVHMHNIMSMQKAHDLYSGHSWLVWLWGPIKWCTLKHVFCQFWPSRLAYGLLRCLKVVIWWFCSDDRQQIKLIAIPLPHACGVITIAVILLPFKPSLHPLPKYIPSYSH